MTPASTWEAVLLVAVPVFPLTLALLVGGRGRTATAALRVAPWAALPALGAVPWAAGAEIHIPWLVLGARWGLDDTGTAFLALTSFLWLCAGIYARDYLTHDPHRPRFFAFFLLSMSGNLGLIVALDAPTFFTFFTLMSFAAYGLVVHERTPDNLRAGRVYIVLVVLGEVLVFCGLVLGAASTYGPAYSSFTPADSALAVGLLLVGFGIKVGVLPVHVWLPLAHPAAPTPASAVLSGAMIKAGLLGWLRFLPLGTAAFPGWGTLALAAGLVAMFYGVVVGLAQRDAKVVLAYSSISQMGYLTAAVGLGLLEPALWPAVLGAIVLYAIHHGLAKAALFLGIGAVRGGGARRLALAGLCLPALALAGAPLTSGASAKAALKNVLDSASLPLGDWIGAPLWLAAFGTALLMGRLLVVVPTEVPTGHAVGRSGWAAWAVVVLASATAGWWIPGSIPITELGALWPVLGGGAMGLLAFRHAGRPQAWPRPVRIPPGDVLGLLEGWRMPALGTQHSDADRVDLAQARIASALAGGARRLGGRARVAERRLQQWPNVGVALLLLLLGTVALSFLGS